MRKIAKFEKVSFEEFKKSLDIAKIEYQNIPEEQIVAIYDSIQLPKRSTKGSAGYDFVSYCQCTIGPNKTVIIPTGIKASIDPGWMLCILPRSSYGFKYRVQLDNTMGIIDSDYYNNPNNEGNIMVKITNCSNERKTLVINPGDRFIQGIFIPYGITVDDEADGERVGGIGSTNG